VFRSIATHKKRGKKYFNFNFLRMKNSTILFALGGGVAIGVAIGILLAPEKGSETRRRLKHFIRDEKKLLQEQLYEFLQSKGIDFSPEEISEFFKDYEKHSCER
jgi:gas vesicle protein